LKPDRRSGDDRRSISRHRLTIDLEYEDPNGRHSGTLSDISRDGCFILGSGQTRDGDEIKIYLPLSAGMKVAFVGEVANHILEIGFAVKFYDLSVAQAEFLVNFIDEHKLPDESVR
jgi:hypothetical protein